MLLGKYTPLDKHDLRRVFLDYIQSIDIPCIDYVAIGIQDNLSKTSASIMSNLEWQEEFKSLGLDEDDPLRNAAFNIKNGFFSFDEIDYQNSAGKKVMRQRKLHGINNGFVFMASDTRNNCLLTLGTGYKNFQAHKFLIENKTDISLVFNDLKNLIMPYKNKI